MVRSARRTRHPSCELARGHCQDRRPAGSRAAGSVRMIGAPPGPPGPAPAVERLSRGGPRGPVRRGPRQRLLRVRTGGCRVASRPEGPQPSSPAPGHGPASGTRATLALGATGRPCRDKRDQSQPVGCPVPPGTTAAAWLPKLADYQDELARARAERLAAGNKSRT
jgi:hypothetical protein